MGDPSIEQRSQPMITITVPLTSLFSQAYCAYLQRYGCIGTNTQAPSSRGKHLYRFTFPQGTLRQRVHDFSYRLIFPDHTWIEEIPTQTGYSYLNLFPCVDK
jgi:hypothetical protein